MKRLTRPSVCTRPDVDKDLFFDQQLFISNISDKFLDLILNGPTLNSVPKDALRSMIRQLYDRLKMYEDTGVLPDDLAFYDTLARDKRLWILPVKPGACETVYFIEDVDVGVESDHVESYIIGKDCNGDIACMAEGSLGMFVNIKKLHLSEVAARAVLLAMKEGTNEARRTD